MHYISLLPSSQHIGLVLAHEVAGRSVVGNDVHSIPTPRSTHLDAGFPNDLNSMQ